MKLLPCVKWKGPPTFTTSRAPVIPATGAGEPLAPGVLIKLTR